MKMTCAEFEVLLADLVDGTLPAAEKARMNAHAVECSGCAELAQDVMGATALMSRAATVDPPPAMVNRILFEATQGLSRVETKPSWIARWFTPLVQPRFAMGMAMTVLSIMMLGRYAGLEIQQLKPSDLNPVKVWTAAENRAVRIWDRTVKGYENLQLVYDVESQLRDWNGNVPADTQREEDR
jgi:anti-sigma factor RsiW